MHKLEPVEDHEMHKILPYLKIRMGHLIPAKKIKRILSFQWITEWELKKRRRKDWQILRQKTKKVVIFESDSILIVISMLVKGLEEFEISGKSRKSRLHHCYHRLEYSEISWRPEQISLPSKSSKGPPVNPIPNPNLKLNLVLKITRNKQWYIKKKMFKTFNLSNGMWNTRIYNSFWFI